MDGRLFLVVAEFIAGGGSYHDWPTAYHSLPAPQQTHLRGGLCLGSVTHRLDGAGAEQVLVQLPEVLIVGLLLVHQEHRVPDQAGLTTCTQQQQQESSSTPGDSRVRPRTARKSRRSVDEPASRKANSAASLRVVADGEAQPERSTTSHRSCDAAVPLHRSSDALSQARHIPGCTTRTPASLSPQDQPRVS